MLKNYFKKHIFTFVVYLNLQKIWNLVLNLVEKWFRVSKVVSTPPFLKIETSARCQLACPSCSHSNVEYKRRMNAVQFLNLDILRKTIDPIAKNLIGVSLSFRGEPLLNPDLAELIKYIHDKKIAVTLPSNFSMKLGDEQITGLVGSGLDTLYVSLDGASRASYLKFRKNGDFKMVLRNVSRFAKIKKRLKLKRPVLIWKFIVFDYNEHEMEFVRENYKKLGFDDYKFEYNRVGDKYDAAMRKFRMNKAKKKKVCYWPWHIAVVMADGEVVPCCNEKEFGLGNVMNGGFLRIWKEKKYVRLRNGFKRKNISNRLDENCLECYDWRRVK